MIDCVTAIKNTLIIGPSFTKLYNKDKANNSYNQHYDISHYLVILNQIINLK